MYLPESACSYPTDQLLLSVFLGFFIVCLQNLNTISIQILHTKKNQFFGN